MLARSLIIRIPIQRDWCPVWEEEIFFAFISAFLLVTCSDSNCSIQQLSEMVSHVPGTDDEENTHEAKRGFSWVMIDLGLLIIPTHFTLRYRTDGFPHWTKTFLFQISKDGTHFLPYEISLMSETNSSTATWTIKTNLNENSSGFRFLRFHQKSSRHPVCIAGLEVYGHVISTIDIRSSESSENHSPLSLNLCFRIRTLSFSIITWWCSKLFNNISSNSFVSSFAFNISCKSACK